MYPHVLNKVCFTAAQGGLEPDVAAYENGLWSLIPQGNETGIPEEISSFGMLFCVKQCVPGEYAVFGRGRCD